MEDDFIIVGPETALTDPKRVRTRLVQAVCDSLDNWASDLSIEGEIARIVAAEVAANGGDPVAAATFVAEEFTRRMEDE